MPQAGSGPRANRGPLEPFREVEVAPVGEALRAAAAEAERLIQGEGGAVSLVRVELDPSAAAGAGALDAGPGERRAEASPARPLEHEDILEPGILGTGPDRGPEAELGDPGRR